MLLTLHVRLCATVAGAWPSARSNTAWHRFQDRVRFAALAAASSSARCVSVRITSIIGISSRDPRAYPFHLSSSTHLVMDETRLPGDEERSPVQLYHVTASPIPVGRVLLPYAVGRERATVLRLAVSALREGSEALALLLAGEAWERLRGEGDRVAEMILLEA